MKTLNYRLLRSAILILGIAYSTIFLFRILSRTGGDLSLLNWVFIIRGVIVMAVGIVVAAKLPRTNEHIFFALFLVNFAFYSWLTIDNSFWVIDALTWSVTAGSFIFAMIVYPGTSAASLYTEYFKARHHPQWYKKAVLFFTAPKKFWMIFFPLLIAARSLAFFSSDTASESLSIFVLICGLIYFRISYNLAGKTDRSRLAWILWGATLSVLLTLTDVLIQIFYPSAPVMISEIIIALTAGIVCLSIIMGVFFAGFLDTGLVVRGTIVYSAVFLSVIFLFSFIEHYILYGLSVMLHIDGGMTAAFLAGFLALAVQPIHNKLEKKLPKF